MIISAIKYIIIIIIGKQDVCNFLNIMRVYTYKYIINISIYVYTIGECIHILFEILL